MTRIAIESAYRRRPVRFLEVFDCAGWTIKLYSLSVRQERISADTVGRVKGHLPQWLQQASLYGLPTYNLATLIIHECHEEYFAIVNWWIGENMLQQFVYVATEAQPADFVLYSDNGMMTCVWEMAVLWHERNAWVDHVLMKAGHPDITAYLNAHFNADV